MFVIIAHGSTHWDGCLATLIMETPEMINPHFTCSRSFCPPRARSLLSRGGGGVSLHRVVALPLSGCPDWVLAPVPRPGWGGGSLLVAPSGTGRQTLPCHHQGENKSPRTQLALRLLRPHRPPIIALQSLCAWAGVGYWRRIYIHSCFRFSSHLGHHRALSRAPCAMAASH